MHLETLLTYSIAKAAMQHDRHSMQIVADASLSEADFRVERNRKLVAEILQKWGANELWQPFLSEVIDAEMRDSLMENFHNPGVSRDDIVKLRQHYMGSDLALLLESIIRELNNAETTPHDALGKIENWFTSRVLVGGSVKNEFQLMREVVQNATDGSLSPVPSGFKEWDDALGGFRRTLTVIGATPGVGKSAFAVGLCLSMGATGQRVGFISLEDEGTWLARRLLAFRGGMTIGEVIQASGDAIVRMNKTIEELEMHESSIRLADMRGASLAEVVQGARSLIRFHQCTAIIVDHLGEIKSEGSAYRHDLEIASYVSELRRVATTAKVPLIVFAHTKRPSGNAPQLSDFANSAGIERMARLAVVLSRQPDSPNLEAHVLKNTEGKSGIIIPLRVHLPSAVVTG